MNPLNPLVAAITRPGITVACVASRKTSLERWHSLMQLALEVASEMTPALKSSRGKIEFTNGSRVLFIAGNAESLKGFRPEFIFYHDFRGAALPYEIFEVMRTITPHVYQIEPEAL